MKSLLKKSYVLLLIFIFLVSGCVQINTNQQKLLGVSGLIAKNDQFINQTISIKGRLDWSESGAQCTLIEGELCPGINSCWRELVIKDQLLPFESIRLKILKSYGHGLNWENMACGGRESNICIGGLFIPRVDFSKCKYNVGSLYIVNGKLKRDPQNNKDPYYIEVNSLELAD